MPFHEYFESPNPPTRDRALPWRGLTLALLLAFGIGIAAADESAAPRPAALRSLEKQGLTIVGSLPNPSGLNAYAAFVRHAPVALFVTPDGKHVVAGTLFDADGADISGAALEKAVARPMADAAWASLDKSAWIADGRAGAPRIVYVFTDPNCPYCNKLWTEARPWVDAGKLQLRHVMVGILTPTSAAKAAALLGDRNPAAALAAYESAQAPANARALAGGRPRPLGDAGLAPLSSVPHESQVRLDANAKLMASFGLRATPAMVWRDEPGRVQVRQGLPEGELAAVFGPP